MQIGRGGIGTKLLEDDSIVSATNGINTIFGTGAGEPNISACGGAAGGSGYYYINAAVNGIGGVVNNSCLTVEGQIFFNGARGLDATSGLTGKGASSIYGSGGQAVKAGYGLSGNGYGAGGSGAGDCSLNQMCLGGDGMEGKILIEWQ